MDRRDYLGEAKKKLDLAMRLLDMGFYEEACYLSYRSGIYSIILLMEDSGETFIYPSILYNLHGYDVPHEVLHSARILDAYSLPHRYPASLPDVTESHFDKEMAEEAIRSAKIIMGFVKERLG